jgi:hypothetical protein
MIHHGFVQDGGFAAGDSISGVTSYAYPSSFYAQHARRKPGAVAAAMLANENPSLTCRKEYDQRNWKKLRAVLPQFPVVNGIVHLPLSAIVES